MVNFNLIGRMVLGFVLGVLLAGCPPTPGGGNGADDTFTRDTTLAELRIASGRTNAIEQNAVVTVTGDAVIDGTLKADSGRLTLRIQGNLTVNGRLQATGETSDQQSPLTAQTSGIYLVVGSGSVTFGPDASVTSAGPVVITDDESILANSPAQLYDDVEDVSGDELPTLAPLSPDNPAFDEERSLSKTTLPVRRQGGAGGPVTISGIWPPAGAVPPPGDRPILIFRFTGNRPLNLDNWTVNGPPAPAGEAVDQSGNAGDPATGGKGREGLRLNIQNDGGPIRIVNDVVLNLSDGGDGGTATAVCANATGGNGGQAGNFRMSAAEGIDLSGGSLTINPGRSGNGGEAIVTLGQPGSDGCPGLPGSSATARGGNGADNTKRLFVRGEVNGVENVSIGPVRAGNGGNGTADACDGGNGEPCCNAGDGGPATAAGGKGGAASVNVSGFAVPAGAVTGGRGGDADSIGGIGGDGGDCKLDDGGDGGRGGDAIATGGDGGTAANSTAGGATGGDGGNAVALGGDGGDGGDSGFGVPGEGGGLGIAAATPGTGGSGTTAGVAGTEEANDGLPGLDGGALPVTLFCLTLADFIQVIPGEIPPGVKEGPVTLVNDTETVGTVEIEFVAEAGVTFQSSDFPVPHVGLNGGTLRIAARSLSLEQGTSGLVAGLRIDALAAAGVSDSNPFVVRALDGSGTVIDEAAFAELPDNFENPNAPESVDAVFDVDESVAVFELIAPPGSFVTIIRVYLLDP